MLLLVTHGDAPTLTQTVESFALNITPKPTLLACVVDGPGALPTLEPLGQWEIIQHPRQLGFCDACATGWELAAAAVRAAQVEYVFWLENDFVFRRRQSGKRIGLARLAAVLDTNGRLAQMAFVRQAANEKEKAAGGLVESLGDAVTRHDGWLEQNVYWTTNPSLIPRRTFLGWKWPTVSECEGKFGMALRDAGWSFGMWGDGRPWVEHIGVRTGKGY
jgi:hypothetical protein